MLGIIALKIVSGMGNETFEVRREQQLAQHGTVGIGEVVGMGIANGDGDRHARNVLRQWRGRRKGHVEGNGLIGIEVGLACGADEQRHFHVVVVDKEQPRSKDIAIGIEYQQLVDTRGN